MTPTAKKYKTQAENAESAMRAAEREVQRLREEKKKCEEQKAKNWSAIVYCSNCLEVSSVSIPPADRALADGDCVVCRKRGNLHLVRKVNCERTQ